MPKFEAKGPTDSVGHRQQKPMKQDSRPKKEAEESTSSVPNGVRQPREGSLGSDFSQGTFEHHASLLGDGRMSQPQFSLQRAAIVRQLQRDYGNRYVQRLVEHISRKRAEAVQTKLTVGPARDKYEQEADSVAKDVMGKLASPDREGAQRQGEEEEELQMKPAAQRQEEEEELQMKAEVQRQEEEEELDMKAVAQRQIPAEGGDVDRELENNIQQAKGGGQALPGKVQSSMEGAFGADFSGVKVHHDAQADTLNDSMSSVAFTTGQDIFFRKGDYNPGSPGGQQLLAHELTHVVQQGGAVVQNAREEEAASPVVQSRGNGIRREVLQRAFKLTKKDKKVLGKYTDAEIEKLRSKPAPWVKDKSLRPIIQAFTESEKAAENLNFLDAAYKFQAGGNFEQLKAIINEYISWETSAAPINLPGSVMEPITDDPISLYIDKGTSALDPAIVAALVNVQDNLKRLKPIIKPFLRTKENILKGPGLEKTLGF